MNLLFLSIILLTPTILSLSPPFKIVAATHHDAGFAIGQQFATNIKNFVNGYSDLSKKLVPFYNSSEGKIVVDSFLAVNALRYPLYFQELEGIALGSNVPLYLLQLLNLKSELNYFLENNPKKEKKINSDLNCADIHVSTGDQVFLAHNEDANLSIMDLAFILDVQILESGQKFVAYTYPGYLPGNAFGWNGEMTFSFNFVYPEPVSIGLARGFINRDIITSTTLTDVITRATPEGRAFGFTLNLGDIKNQKTYCLEIAPTVYSVWEVKKNFSHFNEYKILNIQQSPDKSTEHRQRRADEFEVPLVQQDVLDILGDNQDSDWPIYRNSRAPDHVSTVATVLFDLSGKKISVWDSNPKIDAPVLVLPIPNKSY